MVTRRRMLSTLVVVAMLKVVVGAAGVAHGREVIKIGYPISLSGAYSAGANMTNLPNYRLWAKDVNDRGGIMLSKYNKRVPVELVEYDDRSEIETAVRLIDRLVQVDKVDLLLPPWGTAMHAAVAPAFQRHGYPMLGVTATTGRLREVAAKLPYTFWFLPLPSEWISPLMGILNELRGAGKLGSKVAVLYVADLHGIEFTGALLPQLGVNNFDVAYYKSYPLGVQDLAPQIREVQRLNPDIFIAASYPNDTIMLAEQSSVLGFNPPVMYKTVGTAYPIYKDRLGPKKIEGVMGPGGWNPDFAGAPEYWKRFTAMHNRTPDWWNGAYIYASLQVLEQALERVGDIDRVKLRDVIANGEFSTVMGTVRFKDQFNTQHPSLVGQWQKGEFRGVAPKTATSIPLLFPKPAW